MAGRELPLRFDWLEVPTVPMLDWMPDVGFIPVASVPPFAHKASYAIWDFPILLWQAGYTPTRRGTAPWIMLTDGSSVCPLFFSSRDAAVEWIQSPVTRATFGSRSYPLVWAESAERAEHRYRLEVGSAAERLETAAENP